MPSISSPPRASKAGSARPRSTSPAASPNGSPMRCEMPQHRKPARPFRLREGSGEVPTWQKCGEASAPPLTSPASGRGTQAARFVLPALAGFALLAGCTTPIATTHTAAKVEPALNLHARNFGATAPDTVRTLIVVLHGDG